MYRLLPGDVRLRGPNPDEDYQGRAEIYHNGVWLSLCGNYPYVYNYIENAICGQLGYPAEGAMMYDGGSYGPAPGEMDRRQIRCNSGSTSLSDCSITVTDEETTNCNPADALGVSCDTNITVVKPIRLSGGTDMHAGRLELFMNGVWGTSYRGYSDSYMYHYINAHVACRELFGSRFGGSYLPRQTSSRFGLLTSGAIVRSYVKCEGDESSFLDCPYGSTNRYSHEDDYQVVVVDMFTEITERSCPRDFQTTTTTLMTQTANLTSNANIYQPGNPDPYPPNMDCTYFVQYRQEFTIQLNIYSFSLDDAENTNCLDFLTVYDGDSESSPVLGGPYCGDTTPSSLTSTKNVVLIKFHSDGISGTSRREFRVSVTGQEPVNSTRFSSTSGTIQSPGYPALYGNETDYEWYITTKPYGIVELTFSDFNSLSCATKLELTFIECHYDEVRLRRLSDSILLEMEAMASALSMRTTSSTEMWKQTFTGLSGSITSPEYPHPYPQSRDFALIINQHPGYFVQLNFTSFHLDTRTNGHCQDYVEVYDGSSATSIIGGPYCGSTLPPSLSSNETSMFIRFHTDSFINANSNGFTATYKAIKKGKRRKTELPFHCASQMMTASEGNFTSPGFPSQYPRDTYCIWTITVHPGYAIEATFDEFSVGRLSATECMDANVRVYDSYTVDADRVITTCRREPIRHTVNNVGVSLWGKKIGTNGIVSIGSHYSWPNLPRNRMAMCAYCAYIDNSDSVGGIFYHVYGEKESDAAAMRKATREVREFSQSPDFTATLALVVTWDRVKQGRYSDVNFQPDNEKGEATFQLALITDGVTSYALVYYLTGAMTWTYRGHWSYVIMGRKGIWIYKVGEVPVSPEQLCQQWFSRNIILKSDRSGGFAELPKCPCSVRDAWRKTSYMWTWSRTDVAAQVKCYRLNKASSYQFYPFGKECCYSFDETNQVTYQQLIMDPPYAGSAVAYNPAYYDQRQQYQREDRQGHEMCCLKSSHPHYCQLYYQLRPVGECRPNNPFRFSWLFGNSHILTFDERQSIFNGWGEYTLLALKTADLTFTLQGRMEPMELDDGKHANATVFTAFATEENVTRVYTALDPITKKSLIIYGDRQDYSRRFEEQGQDFVVEADHYTLHRDGDAIVTDFPSGISTRVTVQVKSLALTISMPEKYRGQTRGLLGNFNGIKNDEFVLPDGRILSDNMTDRQLHNNFGAVTNDNTVLRYGPREGPEDLSHPDFNPLFLDEVPPADKKSAEKVCGVANNACIYDYITTGDKNFAASTNQTNQQATQDNHQINNTLPEVTVPANVTVTPGQTVTITVNAKDPDPGDVATFGLLDNANGKLSINQQTGNLTINTSSLEPIEPQ
ncbi:hypothetical protein BaRGS_00032401 [Batillaria attramentaria]|uniref:Uncharacterized protein n=1 Tax=Batillaria attramentaria TaxID=370345 RepID=A0ABD0JPE4_9CAEN